MSPRPIAERMAGAVLRAVLYLRISDVTDTTTSIPRQEREGRAKAESLPADVVAIRKDEDKSGYHEHVDRPGFTQALQDMLTRQADVLIVYKVDRATRQGIPQAAEIIRVVYATGCRFISIQDGIDSNNVGWELQLVIAADQAHRESKNTAGRVADMRSFERDGGRWMGNRPYGFVVTPDRKLELHPQESEIVRAVAAKLLDGQSLRSVAKWLNDQEHDSPRWASRRQRIQKLEAAGETRKAKALREEPMKTPNSWSAGVVKTLVTSHVMTGHLPHKGEIYRHSETGEMVTVGPAIISMADLTQLRATYGGRVPVQWTRSAVPTNRSADSKKAAEALLIDYFHCGECGNRMTHDRTLRKKGIVVPRYRCVRRAGGGRCPGTLMKAAAADELVIRTFIKRLGALEPDDPALIAMAERFADMTHPDRALRRSELEALIHEEEEFLDRLEGEKLSGLFAGIRGEARFRRRYDGSQARLTQYEAELESLPKGRVLDIGFAQEPELLRESWSDWPLERQREHLSLGLKRVWLMKAPASGVRPSVDRLKFWWVGDPEPVGIGVANTVGDPTEPRT